MRAEDLFNAFDELDAELLYDAHVKPQRKQYIMRRMAIAASFVLLIAASFLIYGLFVSPASHIYLDSRESVTLTVNSRGRILSVKSESGSYTKLNGKRIDEAAAVLISDMVENGSISRDENTLIIGADHLTQEDREALYQAASDTLAQYDFDAAVITIKCDGQKDDTHVPPSVGRIIDLLCEHDSTFDRRALYGLSANDLALLWTDRELSDPNIFVSGEASDTGHIGFEAATSKALSMSAFKKTDIDSIQLSYSVYHGRLIYVVRVKCGDRSEAYFINAETGVTEQALRTSAKGLDEAVEKEIKDSAQSAPAEPTDVPTAPQQTQTPAATVPSDSGKAPTQPVPTEQPTEAESADYTAVPITMKELSFITQSVPESAAPINCESLFEGQCFYNRNGEKQNGGSVTVIATYAALQKFLSDNAYPYVGKDGGSPAALIGEDYFKDHSIIAVTGVFSDASYYAGITELRTADGAIYLEASLSYGESRSGEFYCRALSLYGVEKDLILSTDQMIVY